MTEPRDDARPADVGLGDVRRLLGGGWDGGSADARDGRLPPRDARDRVRAWREELDFPREQAVRQRLRAAKSWLASRRPASFSRRSTSLSRRSASLSRRSTASLPSAIAMLSRTSARCRSPRRQSALHHESCVSGRGVDWPAAMRPRLRRQLEPGGEAALRENEKASTRVRCPAAVLDRARRWPRSGWRRTSAMRNCAQTRPGSELVHGYAIPPSRSPQAALPRMGFANHQWI